MDKISVEGLALEVIIGVHEWEQTTPQPVLIDVDLYTDTTAAANTDDLTKTLSYGDIARTVTSFAERSRFKLIETLAEQLAALILADYAVDRIRVRVSKPQAVKSAANVSVTIERSRP
jgi:dihydroneopterin aldolase